MKTTPIQLYLKDIPEPEDAWQLGLWGNGSKPGAQQIWGLAINGWPTHMCYRWPEGNAKLIVERKRINNEKDPHPDWLRWHFDAGRRLYVTLDDLETACRELEIWDTNS